MLWDCPLSMIEWCETMAMEDKKVIEWIAEALLMFHPIQVLAALCHQGKRPPLTGRLDMGQLLS